MNLQLEESLMNHNKDIEDSFKILLQLKDYTEQENIIKVANLLMTQSQIIKELENQIHQIEILCQDQQDQIDSQHHLRQQLISENQKFSSQIYQLQNDYNSTLQQFEQEKCQNRSLSQLESMLHNQSEELQAIQDINQQLIIENKRLNDNNQQLVQIIDSNEKALINLNQQLQQIEILKQEVLLGKEEKKRILQQHEQALEQVNQKILEQQLRIDFFQQQQQSTLQSRMSFSLAEDLNEEVFEKVNETMQSEFQSIMQSTENNETVIEPIDEYVYFSKEYCGLKDNRYIKEIIKKDRDIAKKDNIYCFSDYIFRINIRGEKSKRIMFITENNFYFFEEHNYNIKITRQFPINKLSSILCCESNPILCCLRIKGQQNDDYLIETFKLKDFIEYLNDTLNSQIQISYHQNFQVQFKNYNPKNLNEIGNGLYDGSGKQAAFKVSHKQGFLQMQQKTLFGFQDYVEVFALMTDVGILLFKQAGDMHPLLFVPCADALIIKNPLKCKPNSFKIKYRDCEYIFHATSQALLDEWYAEFNRQVVSQHKLQLSQSVRMN